MDQRLLTENGWKALVQRWKIRDNGLQRALGAYEKTGEDKHGERLAGIAKVSQLAIAQKRAAEATDIPVVINYLAEVIKAAEVEEREINKAQAMAGSKSEAEAKKQEKEEDAYKVKLLAALQKLKGAGSLSLEFIVCDAKPHCAVMVAPQITTQHRELLSRLTDGSKRFLHIGTCRVENGKYSFKMDRPVTGLARKLQESILHFTGKKLPIIVGVESADGDDGEA